MEHDKYEFYDQDSPEGKAAYKQALGDAFLTLSEMQRGDSFYIITIKKGLFSKSGRIIGKCMSQDVDQMRKLLTQLSDDLSKSNSTKEEYDEFNRIMENFYDNDTEQPDEQGPPDTEGD